MIMTTWQGVVTVLMAVLGTIITRFLPFVLFPEPKKPPHIIDYLGNVLPYAMTGLLVVYSLKTSILLLEATAFPKRSPSPRSSCCTYGNATCCSRSPAASSCIWHYFSLFLHDCLFCRIAQI